MSQLTEARSSSWQALSLWERSVVGPCLISEYLVEQKLKYSDIKLFNRLSPDITILSSEPQKTLEKACKNGNALNVESR